MLLPHRNLYLFIVWKPPGCQCDCSLVVSDYSFAINLTGPRLFPVGPLL